MAGNKRWLDVLAPSGWDDVVLRSVLIAVVGFATLCLKDGIESGDWGDWTSPLTDSASIAAVMFVVNAVLKRKG